MLIKIETIAEMKQWVNMKKQQGFTIGFVPTMGFLHEGHLALVEKAKQNADFVVMSIFVNPLQFGEGEDYEDYPRDIVKDTNLAEKHGVDVVFFPAVPEMYPKPMSTTLKIHERVDVLCGASRPGHFDGVATVVMKLFQIISPNTAYFGMKDAQQVAVIQQMVEDFHLDVKVVPVDIVREHDGLAKSSRNVNLSNEEREEAANIYQILKEAKKIAIQKQVKNANQLEVWIYEKLTERISGKIDYIKVVKFPDLTIVNDLYADQFILAVAVYYKRVRLIDNIILTLRES